MDEAVGRQLESLVSKYKQSDQSLQLTLQGTTSSKPLDAPSGIHLHLRPATAPLLDNMGE
jgi:hypothetical protein